MCGLGESVGDIAEQRVLSGVGCSVNTWFGRGMACSRVVSWVREVSRKLEDMNRKFCERLSEPGRRLLAGRVRQRVTLNLSG